MTLYKGATPVAGLAKNTIVTGFNIFDVKWSEHIINDIQWLRADTFSWQSGDVYVTAYNKLVEEYSTGTEETEDGITFRRTTNGYKIADATQETAVSNKYNTDGIAWYYILDTTNKRFKLPRMKYKYWKDQSALPVIGNGMALGLTNGSGNYGLSEVASNIQSICAYGSNYGTSVGHKSGGVSTFPGITGKAFGVTTDATKSGIVTDVSNVISELPMYLYFYVGEYARDAIEQTAGLNTELFNRKLDISASNLSIEGKGYISGLGMPSDRYIDLTLGPTTGSQYTAPANGWFFLKKTATGVGQFIYMNSAFQCRTYASAANTDLEVFMPVRKGSDMTVVYSAGGATKVFQFIYAEGDK